MERRIFGLENEYGVTCTLRGQRRLSPDEVARYLFRKVVSWGRSSNVFLQNGARLYLDVGSHPEYATPECDSLYDLVVHDKAGERIVTDTSRVGTRFGGEPLRRSRLDELPSEGMVEGAVQVPPDGLPIVMLADHPTTGGYPVIAVVDPADISVVAQAAPGTTLRFTAAR